MVGTDFNLIYSVNYVYIMHVSVYFLFAKDCCKEIFISVFLVFLFYLYREENYLQPNKWEYNFL